MSTILVFGVPADIDAEQFHDYLKVHAGGRRLLHTSMLPSSAAVTVGVAEYDGNGAAEARSCPLVMGGVRLHLLAESDLALPRSEHPWDCRNFSRVSPEILQVLAGNTWDWKDGSVVLRQG